MEKQFILINPKNTYSIDEKNSLNVLVNNSSESLPLDESDDSNKDSKSYYLTKHSKINKFIISKKSNKKERKTNVERKRKEDDIRKKIKSCFHKNFLKYLNTCLTKAGSIYTFKSFPQNFITDITKKTNHKAMQLTYGELFEYTYTKLNEDKKYKEKKYNKNNIKAAESKYTKNKEILKYLDNNPEISRKSGWEKIKNTKYIDLLKDFFNSKEFEQSILDISKKEDKDYLESYIYFSKTYIEYYISYQPSEKESNNNKNQDTYNNVNHNSNMIIINNNNILNSTIVLDNDTPNQFSNDIVNDNSINTQNEDNPNDPFIMPFSTINEENDFDNLNSITNDDISSENFLSLDENRMFQRSINQIIFLRDFFFIQELNLFNAIK